ncbi:choline transporter-like protein 4 isoform X2 [Hippocampus comes]|uniref:Choline transporter-like protein n=1 Tax=Hippocampus comes TaxID=109280 RepID=A0A3Q2XMZ5_HIPCM|nr:PREDICTED: choline transporter-like protein 4 isoform X1 [Hippocampus comes]XP_019726408.1 PREDICTED: choline transporter-like protein 4 isoform X2 [Hippocampus comes]XP_019726409.1 PREDICTED: choline transporter-like protein 4 isoform X2 [Hippocampus comes]
MGKEKQANPESQYGEPVEYDPSFDGPIKKRGCTDIICCVVFMTVLLGYIAVGIVAWLYGDPRQVLYPKNSTGWFCGTGPNINRPALFYLDIVKCATGFNVMAAALNGFQCPTTQICVEKCPTDFTAVSPLDYAPNVKPTNVFKQSLCAPSLNLSHTDMTVKEIVEKELCPFYTIPTTSVIGRCLPDVSLLGNMPPDFSNNPGLPPSVSETANLLMNGTGDILNGLSARDIGVRIFEDFASSWPWILTGLAIAMVLSMLFLLLLRFIAGVVVWLLIVAVLCTGAFGIWHCYWQYANYKSLSASITDIGFTTNVSFYLKVQETWLAFLIILCVVEAILILILIFLRNRILIAIALIREASKAVGQMMSTLFYPLLTFVLLLVCVAYWASTALYLATSGGAIYKVVALNSSMSECRRINGTVDCNPQTFKASDYPTCPSAACIFVKYNTEGLLQRNLFNLQIYNVLAFLWCVNFVIALGQCTLAGAFAAYYWAFNKPDDIPMAPLSSAFVRTLRYHVGSLAFGALILTLVQAVRILLEYIDHKTRTAQNACARFILCCMKCCLWCLEKFIKFLNRNAYIMIAVYGKNFCTSAKKAFSLIMRNIIRTVILDKVTDLLLFFGELLVVGGVGVLSFYFFSGRIPLPHSAAQSETLNYYWTPIITVVIGSYLIAHGFFSVYSMCVDTLFLCFLEDLERNDGSLEKPYFMSKNLMKVLNKSNKMPKKKK